MPLRETDYWLMPISIIGTILIASTLFAGALSLQIYSLIPGLLVLLFGFYIIKKHYSLRAGIKYFILFMIVSLLLAWVAYVLTN